MNRAEQHLLVYMVNSYREHRIQAGQLTPSGRFACMFPGTNGDRLVQHTVYIQTNRVASIMGKTHLSFAFRLAAINAMGGENAFYPRGKSDA